MKKKRRKEGEKGAQKEGKKEKRSSFERRKEK